MDTFYPRLEAVDSLCALVPYNRSAPITRRKLTREMVPKVSKGVRPESGHGDAMVGTRRIVTLWTR